MSQHIGDMGNLATLDAFDAAEQHPSILTGSTPAALVAVTPTPPTISRLGA